MAFWSGLFSRKASVDDIARAIALSRSSLAGAAVNAESSMRVAAVYGCVRVISETVGSLPLHIYRRTAGGKIRAVDHPLYRLLHDTPNPWQTAMEFREMMQAHLCLRGNAYAYINWTSPTNASELIPIHPDRVTVRQLDDMSLVYEVRNKTGVQLFPAEDILHIRGLSSDGIVGRSVLEDARESIGVAIATQEYASKFYANDATPSLVVSIPGKLSPEARKRLVEAWQDTFGGSRNARRTAVLEEGAKVEPLAMTFDDAQFLETRKFQRSEIAGIFRVPPHLIGDLERATFGNIEHQSIEFVTHCIRPWLVRWEQALSRALFTAPGIYFPEHVVEGLLRGDIKSRYDAYAVGRVNGWLSANDIRSLENLNPIQGGDVYLQPMNMVPAGSPAASGAAKAVYRGQEVNLQPTAGMKDEAERGLAWRDEFNRGGTQVGVSRARDILNADELSPDTVRRMHSYFSRHEVDKQGQGWSPGEDGYPSAGRIAWALWGGDAGQTWARAKVEQLDRLDESEG